MTKKEKREQLVRRLKVFEKSRYVDLLLALCASIIVAMCFVSNLK